ncbi:MAG: hypothetical protein ACYC0V_00605 [Armatimonadota bacterium]
MENELIYRIYNPGEHGDDMQQWWTEQVQQDSELLTLGTEFTMLEGEPIVIASSLENAVDTLKTASVPYCGAVCVAYHGLVRSLRNSVHGLEYRLKITVDKLNKVVESNKKALHSTKSKTIGCKGCKSTIARSYVGDDFECPVCGNIILAETYKKALIKARTDVTSAENRLPSEEERYQMVDGICYIIGGWKV